MSIENHVFVVVGGTGDLMKKKLLPALYHLAVEGDFGERFYILAVGRSRDMDSERFRSWSRTALQQAGFTEEDLSAWCDDRLGYHSIGESSDSDWAGLAREIERIEDEADLPGNRTFYLAIPPAAFGTTVEKLGVAGLGKSKGWTRLVIEKPFGHDLASGLDLNRMTHAVFDEEQIYRIDHYLGKETVQNLLVFRFGNAIFEDLWNRDRVDSVQITVAEDLGVEDRAGFYERTGALRDIVQNHLTQILCLVAMEVPSAFDAEAVRFEKVKVLRTIQPIDPDDVVFGQYENGEVRGEAVPGYRAEKGVAPDSQTETFVAMRLDIDTWRWQGVPFYIRTGKRLKRKLTEIAVVFRRPPVYLFESMGFCPLRSNVLYITLQPEEGFSFYMDVKRPGEPMELRRIPLDFKYEQEFGALPDAYHTLIKDVLEGDQTLFVHSDEVEMSWRLYTPVLKRERELHPYTAGTWGPQASHQLLGRNGQSWYRR